MHKFSKVSSPEQVAMVAHLAEEIWNQHFVSIIGQAQVNYMLNKFQSVKAVSQQIKEGCEYFIMSRGEEPFGYFALFEEPDKDHLMISKLYVRQAVRGTGAGGAVLDFAVERARKSNIPNIWLTVNRHNKSSIQWYLKKGFFIAGEVKKDIGQNFVMDDFIMQFSVS